ncbi:MAG: hypothetical protein HY390_07370 [Deltaproteobacteria bacterium]|nr:hypothetical protein [Deltaproteobacteria bacterium]
MMKLKNFFAVLFGSIFMVSFVSVKNAEAVSQWSRKYKTSCTTCHTAFPRVNYYGERFMKNGFQDPDADEPDGGTLGKLKKGNVDIGHLEDIFGARINLTPVTYQFNNLTVDGRKKDKVSVGKFNWIQLFTAGTITKNISFFDELELAETSLKHGWFILGLHNLLDHKFINFQVGKISPTDWTSFSNRLRIFPEVSGMADKVAPSAGATSPEDAVAISSGQFGINYYGYYGPGVWALGFGNAKNTTDVNQFKNYWGSVKLEVAKEDSQFSGSSLSFFAYRGTDSKSTATEQRNNIYYRFQPSFNIRWKDWDVIGSYLYADEENFTLAATDQPEHFYGETLLVTKLLKQKYLLGIQLDEINQAFETPGVKNIEQRRLVTHASWLLRDNLRLIATETFDFKGDDSENENEFRLTFRAMF